MGNTIIEITQLSKRYDTPEGAYTALHDVNLSIEEGTIFGIIGLSGAGKSTLVRCINGLEPISGGTVNVLGQSVPDLSAKQLRQLRKSIGMVFQQYNLMPSRTVEGNVALALRHSGLSSAEKRDKTRKLLSLVGLEQHAESHPSQLSGGQQQRVAIARALANNPRILLLDEATSALDPDTTKTILKLVKRLNRELHLTIIVVTHQMDVVKSICSHVAVIDHGTIVEQGEAFDVFANPQAELTRRFVGDYTGLNHVIETLRSQGTTAGINPNGQLIHMSYANKTVAEGLVSAVTERFHVIVNILFASLDIVDGYPLGSIVAQYSGDPEHIRQALDYLRDKGIRITAVQTDSEENTVESAATTTDAASNTTASTPKEHIA